MQHLKKGFTLMEMLVVVAIIAILVAIGIPVFTDVLEHTRETTCAANRRILRAELSVEQLLTGAGNLEIALNKNTTEGEKWKAACACPSGGVITVRGNDIQCGIHQGKDYQNSTGMLNRYQDIQGKWKEYSGIYASNDNFRQYYFNAYCEDGKWPELEVGEKTYYIQPYVDINTLNGKTPSGDMYLFANTNPTNDSKNWGANCIYDAAADVWYTSPDGKSTIGVADKSWAYVQETMSKRGWVVAPAVEKGEVR